MHGKSVRIRGVGDEVEFGACFGAVLQYYSYGSLMGVTVFDVNVLQL
jgi:hypothetical protein